MKTETATVNPWQHTRYGMATQTCDTESRIDAIKSSSDITWLRAVLAWPENQLTVRLAAERRLRRLANHPPQPRAI